MKLLAWFSTSFVGRHLHRAVHKSDRNGACWFCRAVWHPLIDDRLPSPQASDSPENRDG